MKTENKLSDFDMMEILLFTSLYELRITTTNLTDVSREVKKRIAELKYIQNKNNLNP